MARGMRILESGALRRAHLRLQDGQTIESVARVFRVGPKGLRAQMRDYLGPERWQQLVDERAVNRAAIR